jgi:hypothetical protein
MGRSIHKFAGLAKFHNFLGRRVVEFFIEEDGCRT